MQSLRALFGSRELLQMWALREIKVRYKQSLLGAMWAILQPLALTAMFTLVFSYVVRVDTGGLPYPIFAYAALVPWTFLTTAISFGVPSLVNNMNLVTKVYFPREVLPLASVIAAGLDFLVAALVFLCMMLWYRLPMSFSMLTIPVLLILQTLLVVGVVLIGSATIVFFRDVRFVVPLFLQLWLYASPVIYPASLIPARFQGLYRLNPMVGLLESYRGVLLHGRWPSLNDLLSAGIMAVLLCAVGYWVFKRTEPRFADLI